MKYGVCFHVGGYNETIKGILASFPPMWLRSDYYQGAADMLAYKNDIKLMGHQLLGIIDAATMAATPSFDLTQWTDKVTAIAAESPDVPAWEIWNEPNFPKTWLGYMQGLPEQYYDLLRIASPILRSVGALVMGPCTGGAYYGRDTDDDLNGLNWMRQLASLDNGDAANYFDVVSVHPYYESLSLQADYLNKVRAIFPGKPIWATEIGRASNIDNRTEESQNAYLNDVFVGTGNLVDKIFWYELNDNAGQQATAEGWYGLVRTDYSQKPAYASFKSLLTAPQKEYVFSHWQDGATNAKRVVVV